MHDRCSMLHFLFVSLCFDSILFVCFRCDAFSHFILFFFNNFSIKLIQFFSSNFSSVSTLIGINFHSLGNPHVPPSLIVAKIMEQFQLSEQKAGKFMDSFNDNNNRPMSAPPTSSQNVFEMPDISET